MTGQNLQEWDKVLDLTFSQAFNVQAVGLDVHPFQLVQFYSNRFYSTLYVLWGGRRNQNAILLSLFMLKLLFSVMTAAKIMNYVLQRTKNILHMNSILHHSVQSIFQNPFNYFMIPKVFHCPTWKVKRGFLQGLVVLREGLIASNWKRVGFV